MNRAPHSPSRGVTGLHAMSESLYPVDDQALSDPPRRTSETSDRAQQQPPRFLLPVSICVATERIGRSICDPHEFGLTHLSNAGDMIVGDVAHDTAYDAPLQLPLRNTSTRFEPALIALRPCNTWHPTESCACGFLMGDYRNAAPSNRPSRTSTINVRPAAAGYSHC